MGRILTYFNTDVCIYNQSIKSKEEAEYLFKDTQEKIMQLETKLKTLVLSGVKAFRESDDEGMSDYSIVCRILDGEDGLFSEYTELIMQHALLSELVEYKGDKPFEEFVTVDWGHYGDFNISSQVLEY